MSAIEFVNQWLKERGYEDVSQFDKNTVVKMINELMVMYEHAGLRAKAMEIALDMADGVPGITFDRVKEKAEEIYGWMME